MEVSDIYLFALLTVFVSTISLLSSLAKVRYALFAWFSVLALLTLTIWLIPNYDIWIFSKLTAAAIVLIILIMSLRVALSTYTAAYITVQTKRTYIQVLFLIGVWLTVNIYASVYDFENYKVIYASFILFLSLLAFYRIFTALFVDQLRNSTKKSEYNPTVTVAIPARNEDAVLESSLHQHLKSNYQKLEIIVVDDCSHDNTAEIIKSLAHRGVRFIGGKQPVSGWLGKNFAYQQLLDSATGELIIFCGVDIRLSPEAISELVARYKRGNYRMLAVLPRYVPAGAINKLWGIAQQSARYFWHLGVTNLLSTSPTVVGSCWLIDKHEFSTKGGFRALKNSIEPERHIAKSLAKTGQYGFTASSKLLAEVTATKRTNSQFWHIMRVAYPILHRDISFTILAVFGVSLIVLVPYTAALYLVFGAGNSLSIQLLGLSGIVILVSYGLIYYYSAAKYIWLIPFALPFITIQTIVIMMWSLIKYEFWSLDWQGRNVCIPALEFEFEQSKKKHHRGNFLRGN